MPDCCAPSAKLRHEDYPLLYIGAMVDSICSAGPCQLVHIVALKELGEAVENHKPQRRECVHKILSCLENYVSKGAKQAKSTLSGLKVIELMLCGLWSAATSQQVFQTLCRKRTPWNALLYNIVFDKDPILGLTAMQHIVDWIHIFESESCVQVLKDLSNKLSRNGRTLPCPSSNGQRWRGSYARWLDTERHEANVGHMVTDESAVFEFAFALNPQPCVLDDCKIRLTTRKMEKRLSRVVMCASEARVLSKTGEPEAPLMRAVLNCGTVVKIPLLQQGGDAEDLMKHDCFFSADYDQTTAGSSYATRLLQRYRRAAQTQHAAEAFIHVTVRRMNEEDVEAYVPDNVYVAELMWLCAPPALPPQKPVGGEDGEDGGRASTEPIDLSFQRTALCLGDRVLSLSDKLQDYDIQDAAVLYATEAPPGQMKLAWQGMDAIEDAIEAAQATNSGCCTRGHKVAPA